MVILCILLFPSEERRLWKEVTMYTYVVRRRMNEEESSKLQEKSSKLDTIYKVLETVFVSEIILCIYGAFTIAYWFPAPLVIFYWIIIPWSTLITGILFLIVRYMKRNYLREEVPL